MKMRIIVMVSLIAVLLSACATSQKFAVEIMPEKELGQIQWGDGSKEQVVSSEEAKRLADEIYAQKSELFIRVQKSYIKHDDWSFSVIYEEFEFKPPEELRNKARYISVTLRNAPPRKKIHMSIMAIVKETVGFRLPATPQWMEWAKEQIQDYETEVAKEWGFKKRT